MPTKKPFRLPHHPEHAVHPAEADPDSRDGRITSVMPLLVKKLNDFRKSLKAGELDQFGVTDLAQEVWLELCEKDHYFDPAKAKYITFANLIVQQKLADIRNRWHLVPGPRDTVQQLRLTGSTPKLEAIRRTLRDHAPIDECDPGLDRPADEELARKDAAATAATAAREAIRNMTDPIHLMILRWTFGLSGSAPKTVSEIAALIGRTTAQAIAARKEALREMGEALASTGITYN